MSLARKCSRFVVLNLFVLLFLSACGGGSSSGGIQGEDLQIQDLQGQDFQTQDDVVLDDVVSGPRVVLATNVGEIELELDEELAPISVQNFLDYVDSGQYDGTIFHRVIPGFVIQGGGFNQELVQLPVNDPIQNEATNGLRNVQYTLAMARTAVVNSATAQFFINVVDNPFLDHRDTTDAGFGFAVFGRVVAGQEIVDQISVVPTGAAGRFTQDVPVDPIIVESARRL